MSYNNNNSQKWLFHENKFFEDFSFRFNHVKNKKKKMSNYFG